MYSDSEIIGDLVHVAGQVAIDKAKAAKGDRTLVGAGDVTKEAEQVLSNLAACLEKAGANQILTATCYLTDINDYAAFNEVYKKFFSTMGVSALPARACFAVIKLPFGAKVEVSCVASLKKSTAVTPGGIYSDAQVGSFIYVAGQVPIDKVKFAQGDKSLVGAGDISKETEQVLSNLRDVLVKAGSDLAHVVQATCYLTDMGNYVAFNEVYAKFFAAPRPARVCVQVGKLPLGAIVEVECIAVPAGSSTTWDQQYYCGSNSVF
jgi:2-iminobutanoate/2-iminopropanoate deaminase